jgi:hypothetical protein
MKIRHLYILLFLLNSLIYSNCYATGKWSRHYSDETFDRIHSLQQTLDGGYILVGEMKLSGFGQNNLWTIKFDGNGDIVWKKVFSIKDIDYETFHIQQTSDSGYIIASLSTFFGTGNRDVYLLKLNKDGSLRWKRRFGGSGCDQIHAIFVTGDSGYIAAGWTNKKYNSGNFDFWILKINKNGFLHWQKTYGGTYSEQAHSIQQTEDGHYIVAGWTYSFTESDRDIWLLKLDTEGDVIWEQRYPGSYYNSKYLIRQLKDTGFTVESFTLDRGEHDIRVLKLSKNGKIDKKIVLSGIYNDYKNHASCIQPTFDNGYILAGKSNSFGFGDSDIWLLKLKPDGDLDWQKTYGGSKRDYPEVIRQTSDKGFIVAGWSCSSARKKTLWMLKLDEKGEMSD